MLGWGALDCLRGDCCRIDMEGVEGQKMLVFFWGEMARVLASGILPKITLSAFMGVQA